MLAAAVAAVAAPLLATGCSKGFGAMDTPPAPRPDVAVLTAAIASEKLMIARYQAVLAASPGQAGKLDPLLADHRAHLAALTRRLVPGAARPTPSPRTGQPQVPAAASAAVAYLGGAENAAAAALLSHLATASPSLAQLLASIAASEATHAAALGVTGSAG
jgi:hypothetical protein